MATPFPEDKERDHVHDVYSQIAHHFSDTRYNPWPRISGFLSSLPPGSLVADIGCGNGKYLGINEELLVLGSDICPELVTIARGRGHEVAVCDCLQLPYKSGVFDAVISIAVIHHLSTEERRRAAIEEMVRILRPGGQLLVYVWAMEQTKRKFTEQDVMIPWHLQPRYAAAGGLNDGADSTSVVKKKKREKKRRKQKTNKINDVVPNEYTTDDLSHSTILQSTTSDNGELINSSSTPLLLLANDTDPLISTPAVSNNPPDSAVITPNSSNSLPLHNTDEIPDSSVANSYNSPLHNTADIPPLISPPDSILINSTHRPLINPSDSPSLVPPVNSYHNDPTPSQQFTHLHKYGFKTYYRYYHVFIEGELVQLCEQLQFSLKVTASWYDHENWCIEAVKL